MRRVVAIASIFEPTPLAGHFIGYYRRLGVDDLILCVQPDHFTDLVQYQHKGLAALYPLDMKIRGDVDDVKDGTETLALAKYCTDWGYCGEDYKLCLDIDEFHEYPVPLKELVRRMEGANEWALCGTFTDRFGNNYTTPPVSDQGDIFCQFPLKDKEFSKACGAWPTKVMISKVKLNLVKGRHNTRDCGYIDRHNNVELHADQFHVHHFKWTEGVEERLQRKIDDPLYTENVKAEYKCELKRLAALQGRN